MSDVDYKKAYGALSRMFEEIRYVTQGRCPRCGEVREDDDCRNCGHHSVYVPPFMSDEGRPLDTARRGTRTH